MSTILQADEEGRLELPPSILPDSEPRALYSLERTGRTLIIQKQSSEDSRTPEQRLQALREWLGRARTPAGLSDFAVSRDSIYD